MAVGRIILTDDHTLFRAGLRSLLDHSKIFKIIGEAHDGAELLDLLKRQKCDLVVLDLSMPRMDGIEALKKIAKQYPKVKILVLTMQKDAEHFKTAMRCGAAGYLLKDDAFDKLVSAVKAILKGKQFISPAIADLITSRFIRCDDELQPPSLEVLTKRERQILKLIAAGMANKNIASRLKISIRTVESHRSNLTQKLGIKSTASLVKLAMSKGLA